MIDGLCFFFFSRRRRHTRYWRDWSSDVCSSDLGPPVPGDRAHGEINTIKGKRKRMRAREAKLDTEQIGRASGRERVEISGVAGSLKKKKKRQVVSIYIDKITIIYHADVTDSISI